MPEKTPIFVLFGSQTGNSEHYATELGEAINKGLGNLFSTSVCSLDDFLYLHHADFSLTSGIFLIVVSSYGVGQAPMGAQRFRDVCDAWIASGRDDNNKLLAGMKYALCGLGDSNYTTFFKNPTRIDQGLQAEGATRFGPLGKADASPTATVEQETSVRQWQAEILKLLPKQTVPPKESIDFVKVQRSILSLIAELDVDYTPPAHISGIATSSQQPTSSSGSTFNFGILALLALVLALAWKYLSK